MTDPVPTTPAPPARAPTAPALGASLPPGAGLALGAGLPTPPPAVSRSALGAGLPTPPPDQVALRPPRPALRVGVVGGRKFGTNDDSPPPWLAERLKHLFGVIASELGGVQHSEGYYDKSVKPLIRVVTGLADGADQWGARAALEASEPAAGFPADLDLFAILPFPRDEYESTISDKPAFQALVADARTTVLVLGGKYEAEDESQPADNPANVLRKRRRQHGYRAQGWFLRQQSDLLLAVWDPTKEGKPGGTEDTVRRALYSGLPVAWIDPNDQTRQRLLTDPAELEGLLNGSDPLALRPPPAPADGRPVGPVPYDFEKDLRTRGVRDLLVLHDEPRHSEHEKGNLLGRLFHGALSLLQGRPLTEGAEKPTEKEALAEYFADTPALPEQTFRGWLWDGILRLLGGSREKISYHEPPALEPFGRYREPARKLANHYAGLYRGAFALNYVLGALALLFALGYTLFPACVWVFLCGIGLGAVAVNTLYARARAPRARMTDPSARARALNLLQAYGFRGAAVLNYVLVVLVVLFLVLGLLHAAGEMLALVLALLEFLCVVVIIGNTFRANSRGFQKRSISCRFLADLLRPMRYLGRLCCATPSWRLPALYEQRSPRLSWTTWLFRAVARAAPPLPQTGTTPAGRELLFTNDYVRQCLDHVKDGWLAEQEGYHTNNARQMLRANRRIELITGVLFVVAALATAIHIGRSIHELASSEKPGGATPVAGTGQGQAEARTVSTGDEKPEANPVVSPRAGEGHAQESGIFPKLLSLGSLWFPALALFFNGLRTQAECRRLGERSEMMRKRLSEAERPRLERLDRTPFAGFGCPAWTVAIEVHELAQVMIDEVADWSIIYRMHEVGP